jgi:hypothetical protein
MGADDVRPNDDVESAIAHVLDAERAARVAIDDAGVAAVELAESARAEARALAERTERRIRAVRKAFRERTARSVAALEAAAAEALEAHELTPTDLARLDAAVAALAARLTGNAP